MIAREALREVRRRGVSLAPQGTFLRFRGPKGALSEELKRDLVKHKPEILVLLGGDRATYPCSTCGGFAFAAAGTVCHWCRGEVTHEA